MTGLRRTSYSKACVRAGGEVDLGDDGHFVEALKDDAISDDDNLARSAVRHDRVGDVLLR